MMGHPIVMMKAMAGVMFLCCAQMAAAANDQQQQKQHGVISPGKKAAVTHLTTHLFDTSKPLMSSSDRAVPGGRALTVKLSEASVSKKIISAGQFNSRTSSSDDADTWQSLKVCCQLSKSSTCNYSCQY
jgi:hypothetical protein